MEKGRVREGKGRRNKRRKKKEDPRRGRVRRER